MTSLLLDICRVSPGCSLVAFPGCNLLQQVIQARASLVKLEAQQCKEEAERASKRIQLRSKAAEGA